MSGIKGDDDPDPANLDPSRDALIALVRDIENAADIAAASQIVDDNFSRYGARLLSVKICDTSGQYENLRPFSGYPKSVGNIGRQLQPTGGCPFSKEATRRLLPFDSATIDRSRYRTFLDKRFFQEIDKLPHQHIAIVPIMVGRAVALFTVGLFDSAFEGDLKDHIRDTIGQTVSTYVRRFPEVATIFEQKHLSDLERSVIQEFCSGLTMSEVSRSIDLSEIALQHLLDSAKRKLGARTRDQLIYKATILGELGIKVDHAEAKSLH